MKSKIFLFCLYFWLILLAQVSFLYAQQTQATVGFKELGISVSFRTEMRNAENSLLNAQFNTYVFLSKENIIHRVLADPKSGLYFGYDFVFERETNQTGYKVSIKPLSIDLKNRAKLDRFTSKSLPQYPQTVILKEGETLILGLLENPQTKVRIDDSIKISNLKDSIISNGKGSNASANEAQDFTPSALELRLNNAKLLINDKTHSTLGKENYVTGNGEFLYLYIPDKGRFIFSLVPPRNYDFKKTGTLEGNKISFISDETNYQIISAADIFDLRGKWNLWVYHEPQYKPKNFSGDKIFKVGTTSLTDEN